MKTVADRRAYTRQAAVPNRASLDWGSMTKDGGRDSRVLDISRGGASVETLDAPPIGQDVWLRLESPAPTSWINATVVRGDGTRRVGIRFDSDCPDDMMLAATLGISLVF